MPFLLRYLSLLAIKSLISLFLLFSRYECGGAKDGGPAVIFVHPVEPGGSRHTPETPCSGESSGSAGHRTSGQPTTGCHRALLPGTAGPYRWALTLL